MTEPKARRRLAITMPMTLEVDELDWAAWRDVYPVRAVDTFAGLVDQRRLSTWPSQIRSALGLGDVQATITIGRASEVTITPDSPVDPVKYAAMMLAAGMVVQEFLDSTSEAENDIIDTALAAAYSRPLLAEELVKARDEVRTVAAEIATRLTAEVQRVQEMPPPPPE